MVKYSQSGSARIYILGLCVYVTYRARDVVIFRKLFECREEEKRDFEGGEKKGKSRPAPAVYQRRIEGSD